MKFILIGRTATGKHNLAEKLAAKGLKIAPSYSTNTEMPTGIGYPNIVSNIDAQSVPLDQKFIQFSADPSIQNYMLNADLAESDVIICHPNDLATLVGSLPGESIHLLHMVCADAQAQDAMEKSRYTVGKTLKERQMDESQYYSKFEQDLAAKSTFGLKMLITHQIDNDFQDTTLDGFVVRLMATMNCRKNLQDIVENCMILGIIPRKIVNDVSMIPVQYTEPKPLTEDITVDMFIDILTESPTQLTAVLLNWLSLSHDVTAGNRAYVEAKAAEKAQKAAGDVSDKSEPTDTTTDETPADALQEPNTAAATPIAGTTSNEPAAPDAAPIVSDAGTQTL